MADSADVTELPSRAGRFLVLDPAHPLISDKLAAPGFLDLHVHGFDGRDFLDPDPARVSEIALGLARQGVTGWLATYAAAPEEELLAGLDALSRARKQDPLVAATCLGVHLEGPFLNPERAGAQRPGALLEPDLEVAERLLEACSFAPVRLVTLAPELPGARQLAARIKEEGALVNLGHSSADLETARGFIRDFQAGATHLWNAMAPLHHREPGLVGAALEASPRVELITDGHHLHPLTVRMAVEALGPRAVAVSDGHPLAGVTPGDHQHWGQRYRVGAPGEGIRFGETLGGSDTPHPEMLRFLVEDCGITRSRALDMMTLQPAIAVGLEDERGALREGLRADYLIFDPEGELRSVHVGGEPVPLS